MNVPFWNGKSYPFAASIGGTLVHRFHYRTVTLFHYRFETSLFHPRMARKKHIAFTDLQQFFHLPIQVGSGLFHLPELVVLLVSPSSPSD
jgi:hypothetical protein